MVFPTTLLGDPQALTLILGRKDWDPKTEDRRKAGVISDAAPENWKKKFQKI